MDNKKMLKLLINSNAYIYYIYESITTNKIFLKNLRILYSAPKELIDYNYIETYI